MAKPKGKTKTNAVRLLESRKIPYSLVEYEVDESDLSAVHAASNAGLDPEQVFKTLVLKSCSGEVFVCVIPGACELDLKKAARAGGFKKADLIPLKEILPLTGYIRGGCSPLGMTKHYPTFIDDSCQLFEKIYVSAGMRGLQIEISPQDLKVMAQAVIADLV